jgi:hypothetical protein
MENKESQYRKIIHIDMDAFFASTEQRDNPHFMKPVNSVFIPPWHRESPNISVRS